MANTQMPLRLERLGAQWLLTGQMAIAFARCILRLAEKDPRRAFQATEMFELWLAGAVSQIACQIDTYGLADDSDPDVRRMHAAAHCFILMILFVQRLKQKFSAKIAALATSGFSVALQLSAPREPFRAVPFIDTS